MNIHSKSQHPTTPYVRKLSSQEGKTNSGSFWLVYALAFMLPAWLAACGASPETRYYTLSALQPAAPSRTALSLHKVSLPGTTDRPQIVLRSAANEIIITEDQRWAEPFEDMVRRVLAEDLDARPSGSTSSARINVTIEEFSGDRQGNVLLKASWTITTARRQKAAAMHHFEKTETASSADMAAIAATMSHVLSELAYAIRSDAELLP